MPEILVSYTATTLLHDKQLFAQFQASIVKQMRTAFFWVIIQREAVIPHQHFGTTYRSHLQSSRTQNRKLDTLEWGLYREQCGW